MARRTGYLAKYFYIRIGIISIENNNYLNNKNNFSYKKGTINRKIIMN